MTSRARRILTVAAATVAFAAGIEGWYFAYEWRKTAKESANVSKECLADLKEVAAARKSLEDEIDAHLERRVDQVIKDTYTKFGENIYPSFLFSPVYAPAADDIDSLSELLVTHTTSPDAQQANVCKLFNNPRNGDPQARGTCTFIAEGWILASYHQIIPPHERVFIPSRTYGLLTSRGDYFESSAAPGQELEIVATSPRDDLALLRVRKEYSYISPVCILPEARPELKDLTLVRLEEQRQDYRRTTVPFISAERITKALPTDDVLFGIGGMFQYKLTRVGGPPFIQHGDSGSPVYTKEGCLLGLTVQTNEKTSEWYFSPRVADFVQAVIHEAMLRE